MTFIAEYFNDISTAQYEDTVTDCNNLSAVLQTFCGFASNTQHLVLYFIYWLIMLLLIDSNCQKFERTLIRKQFSTLYLDITILPRLTEE